ncbi:MAG: hypothetical protein ACOC9W_01570 [Persicimonas sp.]
MRASQDHAGSSGRPKWRSRLTASAAALLVVAGAVPLHAQSGGDVETFREHVKRGAELRKSGEHRQALEEFDKARAIADHPKLGYAVGRIYEDLGDCAQARAEFEQSLADGRAKAGLEDKLNEALEENQHSCVDRGSLTVECIPEDARLRVDGESAACTSEVELTAGEHTLEASAPERKSKRVVVTVEPGGEHRQTVELGSAWEGPAVTYTKYGAVGLGGALLLGAIFSDAGASSRQDELAEASEQGDIDRAERLSDEADSAQTRTVVLYSLGTLFVAGGAALWIYDAEAEALLVGEDATDTQAGISVGGSLQTDGAMLEATFQW